MDDDEVATLAAALELLAARPDVRAAMGAAARELAAARHDLDRVADLYAAACELAAGGAAVADAVLGEVSAGGGRRGIEPGSARGGRARPAAGRGRAWSVERARRLPRSPRWGWLVRSSSSVVRSSAAWLARGMVGAVHHGRRAVYSELGRSLADDGELARPRRRDAGYGLVYPLLIAPGLPLFDSLPDAYALVKTTNALVMSLAAVPAYLLARRVVGPWLALLAAVLARRSCRRWPTPAR